ncbi:MAG: acetyl-CoA hydrolase/transferase C-terminal domain-containing protein, partial [Oscillospiraceae bacterium]|nr:acetyl-CoA hydrolase/transferase C-terminal domain-containing protein [Oscillospiraceae bacterium]
MHCIKGHAGDFRCVTDPAMNGHISFTTFLYGRELMVGHTRRNVSFVPADIADFGTFLAEHRPRDTFVACVSPMDEHGYFQLGLTNMWEQASFKSCDTIILEVNPQLPRVKGGLRINIRDVTVLTEVDYPPLTVPDAETTEIEERIGANVAELVHDGDTIQLGIGSMPNAVGHHLMDKKDLGLHTEMFTSIMGEMIRKGVITGQRKNYNRGLHIGCFAGGDQALYDTLATNPNVRIQPTFKAVDPGEICKNDNMISINTIIEMDITGQVCSESIGPKQFSGTGGAFCFAYGALHSRGGKGILAFQAATKKGISKISPQLKPGAVVSIPRNYVDYVVTEYGIAHLRGRSVKERALQLIAISHPEAREELTRYAKEQFILI